MAEHNDICFGMISVPSRVKELISWGSVQSYLGSDCKLDWSPDCEVNPDSQLVAGIEHE
jgi:hypothetical protein